MLALLLLTAWLGWPALNGPFVFDDFPNLKNLAQLNAGITRESLGQYLYHFPGNPGRPLAALSFLVDDAAWPADPAPFKRTNLLLHLLCAVLIFAFARRLSLSHPATQSHATGIAMLTMAAWLIHPLQLSGTLLVVQRMNLLSTVFMLVGLLLYVHLVAHERISARIRVTGALAALGGFGALAFLCKENGALIFAYATACNLSLLDTRLRALATSERRLLVIGAATPVLLLALAALLALPEIARSGYQLRDFNLSERLLTQPRVLFDYLQQIFLPRLSEQGIYHDDYPISHGLMNPPGTAAALLALTAALVTAVGWRRRLPLYAFAVLFYVAGHLIESTIIPLEIYFEHRNYLPMFGPLFALAAAVLTLAPARRRLLLPLFGLWLLLLATLWHISALTWSDRALLAHTWANDRPASLRATQELASYYFDHGDPVTARSVLEAGIASLPPQAADTLRAQRTLLDCYQGTLTADELAELGTRLRTASYVRTLPEVVTMLRHQLAGGQACQGRLTTAALATLLHALLDNPIYANHAGTAAYLHYELGQLAVIDRDLDRAMRHLDDAVAARADPLILREQAVLLWSAGLPESALEYLDRSDTAPIPRFKAWLLQMPARNRPLREQITRSLSKPEQTTPEPA